MAERTSRNVLEVLNRLGLLVGHSAVFLARKTIASECMEHACKVERGSHSLGWNNIQCLTSIFVEQGLLNPQKVQSGTASTIYELCNATRDSCRLIPLLDHIKDSDDISFHKDVQPSEEQWEAHVSQILVHIILILISHERFQNI